MASRSASSSTWTTTRTSSTAFVHDPARKLLLASHDGNGFVVPESEVVANTRKGKQVMNVARARRGEALRACRRATIVAVVGENRKMLVFPLAEVPEMARGKGVRLQSYKDGGVLDIKTFDDGGGPVLAGFGRPHLHAQSREELAEWIGARASAGRMVPKGFPRTGKFG